HVERMQRTFKDEFYTRPLPTKIPKLQRELDDYLEYYNRQRPHRAPGGLAPLEYLATGQAANAATGELLGKLAWGLVPPVSLGGGDLC
ncbi:integrase core domain-containing protein, partial [Oceanithermus sp.]